MKILVSGATGYVGSRLVPRLLVEGHEVSCLVRRDSRVPLSFPEEVRLVRGDALQPETLAGAMQGIEVAYYLIHSMAATGDFKDNDRRAAQNFASAAKIAGVGRIVFLGALASESAEISSHLQSRHETGDTLRQYGPPVTEFRAGIIVGNGSVSFELIRYLTERLPVMICPRWVITRTQPIAIDDVLQYLVAAVETPASTGQVIEIGGASVETYRSMMLTYARARGLKRWLIRVPILTPRLSSYWLRLITPLPTSITRPLIEGLRTEVVCKSAKAAELFPGIRPEGYSKAIEKTLARAIPDDSLTQGVPATPGHFFVQKEGLLCDVRQEVADASPQEVFSVISRLGGSNGYLYANSLWRMRGWMDSRLGGVGMTRGLAETGLSKDGRTDFWYVEDFEGSRRLLLRAEMKLPGRAWLEFLLSPQAGQKTLVRCCAWFEPRGLLGELYWWVLYPIHILIFRGMVQAVCNRSKGGTSAIAAPVRNPS
jgi:uncharacterized protein YbjT (DUF2867 family)